MKVRNLALLLASSTALVTPATLMAAEAHPQDPAGTVQEVIVTARKRSEDVQKVSVAVSVVGADQIKKTQAFTSNDLVAVLPSVNMQNGGQASASSFVVRGVGTFSYSSGAEPSVSTMVDGVVLARSGMAFMDLVDIDHVEVLRGPQGTLFGKNASAGLIHIVSKDPSSEPEAEASASVIEMGEYHAGLTASAPLTDTLGVRLTGALTNDGGYTRNVNDGKLDNGHQSYLLRGVLKWRPTDDLTFRWRSDISRDHFSGPALTARFIAPSPQLDAQAPVVPSPTNNQINVGATNNTVDKAWGHSLQADWDVSGFTATSITAYRDWREATDVDDAFGPVNPFGLAQPDAQRVRQFSEELRLTSPQDHFLTYVAGLFYYDEKLDRQITRTFDFSDLIGLPLGPVHFPADIHVDSENYAAFGEATAHLSERLRLVAGARWTHDKISYDYTQGMVTTTPLGAAVYPELELVTPVPTTSNSTSNDNFSVKASLEWDVLPTAMAYFSFAQGYKGPAFSLDIATSPEALQRAVQPETSNAYELGLKSAWFDHRLVVNAAAFYTDFKDFQAQTQVSNGFTFEFDLTNAAKVHTAGLEVDVVARPLEGLNLNAGFTVMEAKFDSYPNGPCSTPQQERGECPAGSQDLSGGRLPFAPTWKGYLGADYTIPLASAPVDLVLNGNYHFQSDVLFDVSQDPGAVQKAYGVFDTSAELVDKNQRYSLTVFVKNVFNQHYVDAIIPFGSPIYPEGYAQIIDKYSQRRVGVELRYKFK